MSKMPSRTYIYLDCENARNHKHEVVKIANFYVCDLKDTLRPFSHAFVCLSKEEAESLANMKNAKN
jgi:hypothetical protein